MTADANASSSPKRDNVYMTWTRFNASQATARSSFSQSTDGGATWSTARSRSAGRTRCDLHRRPPWAHATTTRAQIRLSAPTGRSTSRSPTATMPGAGMEQVLNVTCPASADSQLQRRRAGRLRRRSATWSNAAPSAAEVTNGCPNRRCLPPNGYRALNETTVTNSVDRRDGNVSVT